MENMPKGVREEALERIAKDKAIEKELAENALASSQKMESPVKLKELSLQAKAMLAELLTIPAYKKIFGKYESESLTETANAEISPKDMDILNEKMSDPRNRFKNGKYILGGQEAGAELHARAESWKQEEKAEFDKAKTDFEAKFGNKIKIWADKGYKVDDMNALVKAYMNDKGADLITTKDKKVAWGQPAAGYEVKL